MNNSYQFGYCTNVHAGVTVDDVKMNLEKYAIPVKQSFSPNTEMGIGLWLSNDARLQLTKSDRVSELGAWLRERGLIPFTFNAFPYDDFHQPVVKHNVYRPAWSESSRLEYTVGIAEIHSQIIDAGNYGTISTLPLGWPDMCSEGFLQACSANLLRCVDHLDKIRQQTGRHIFLCIEPEPGCILESSKNVVDFFDRYIDSTSQSQNDRTREYLGVCHDICHSAVMFEPQETALQNYKSAGIRVGKFQISSAIEIAFSSIEKEEKPALVNVLNGFAEDRYLHQTVVFDPLTSQTTFFEDLPLALSKHGQFPTGDWRVHFHVPIFANEISVLGTTASDIEKCLRQIYVSGDNFPLHFEIETYAWTVLPESLRPKVLSDGIARELTCFRDRYLPMVNPVG